MTTRSNIRLNHDADGSGTYFKHGISKTRLLIFLALALGIGFMIGILIGRYAICDENDREGLYLPGVPEHLVSEADPDISKKILDAIDPNRIRENLRYAGKFNVRMNGMIFFV